MTFDFTVDGSVFQVRADSISAAIACLRQTLPQSNVDYSSLRECTPDCKHHSGGPPA